MGNRESSSQNLKLTNNKYISLSQAGEIFNYTRQHLSLLIRLNKLKAVKIGNFYYTCEEWMRDYIKNVKKDNINKDKNDLSKFDPVLKLLNQSLLQRDISLPLFKIVWTFFVLVVGFYFFNYKPIEILAFFSKPQKFFTRAIDFTDKLTYGYIGQVHDLLFLGLDIYKPANLIDFGDALSTNIATLANNLVDSEVARDIRMRVTMNVAEIKTFFYSPKFFDEKKTNYQLEYNLSALTKIINQKINEKNKELEVLKDSLTLLENKLKIITANQPVSFSNNGSSSNGKNSNITSVNTLSIERRISDLEASLKILNKAISPSTSFLEELLSIKQNYANLNRDLVQFKNLLEKLQEKQRLTPLPIFAYQSAPVIVSPAANVSGFIGQVKNAFEDSSLIPAQIRVGDLTISGKNISSLSTILPDSSLLTLGGSLIPATTTTYDLGSSSNKWNTIYAQSLTVNSLSSSGQQIITYQPVSSSIGESSLYINPVSATSTFPLFGMAINGSEKFRVNANGDFTTQGVLTVLGSATSTFSGPLVQSGGNVSLATTTISGGLNAFTLLGNISGLGSPNIIGIGQFSGASLNISGAATTSLFTVTGTSTLGVITSGTWQGSLISTQYGGTGQNWSAVAQGSLPYFSATGVMSTLAPGTANQVLITGGAGANPSFANIASLLTAGSGISITGTTNATITNTGVLSLNTLTGALTLQGTADQINVSSGGSTITLATPQDIATSSSPTFASLTLSGTTPLTLTGASPVAIVRNTTTADVLAINNSGTGFLSLNLVDGGLQTAGTERLTNAGALTNITGITSSGTITFSGLTTAGPVITSAAGVLSSEAQLSIARGGTASTASPTAGAVAYGTGSAYAFSAAGTANQVLISGGAGAPSWSNIASLLTAGTNISITGTTNATIATVANPTFATSVTTPNLTTSSGALTISTGASAGADDIIFSPAGAEKLRILENGDLFFEKGVNDVTLTVTAPAASRTYTLPDFGANVSLVGSNRTINTTSPLAGGGDLSADRTLSLAGLSSLGTANYLVGVNSGATAWEYKNLLGTANQITVTHGAGSITLATPQDIATSSSPTFAGLTLSGLTSGSVLFAGAGGALSQDNANLFWDNTNKKLGIGTTTPAYKLHVDAGSSPWTVRFQDNYGYIDFGPAGTGGAHIYTNLPRFYFNKDIVLVGNPSVLSAYSTNDLYLSTNDGLDTRMTILASNGNVGIGTTAPTAKLTVVDNGESTLLTTFTQAVSNAGLLIQTEYTADAYTPGLFWLTSNNAPTKPKAGLWMSEHLTGTKLYLGTSNSYATGITNQALTIDMSGNVGIGTTAPGAKLDVQLGSTETTGSIIRRVQATNDTGFSLVFYGGASANTLRGFLGVGKTGTGSDTIFTGELADSFGIRSQGALHLGGSGNNLTMTLTGGNVGIGTTAPASKLHILGTGTFSAAGVSALNLGSHTVTLTASPATFRAAEIGAMTLTASSAQTVTTASSLFVATPAAGANVTITNNKPIDTQTGAYLSSGGAWTNASSRELKTNFSDINPQNILDNINKLKIQSWSYQAEPNVKHIGPFSEDFYNLFGVGNDDKTLSSVDPAGVALVGVQALSKQIEDLKLAINQNGNLTQNGQDLNIQLPINNLGSIFNDLISAIKEVLTQLSGTVRTAGEWVFNKISARTGEFGELKIKSEQLNNTGITIYDRITGEAYCIGIENGEWMKIKGECSQQNRNQSSSDQSTNPSEENPSSLNETDLNQNNISTSTPEEVLNSESSANLEQVSSANSITDSVTTTVPATGQVETTNDQQPTQENQQ